MQHVETRVSQKTLPTRLPSIEEQQKEIQYPGYIRTLLGKDCEIEKIMRFLGEIGIIE